MGTKAAAKKKSRAMKIVLATIRTFSKAKNFYMLSMEQFGNGVAGNPNPQASPFARSFSVISAANKASKDRAAGLPRSMSSESRSKPNYDVGSYNNHKKGSDNEMKRSCSVGEQKMRRIDEDESCSFREDVTVQLLYPRSKSYSVKENSSYMKLR